MFSPSINNQTQACKNLLSLLTTSATWRNALVDCLCFLGQELGAETRREIASREAANRAELRAKLAGLPQPENEYEVTVPELPEADEAGEGFEEDAADLAARKKLEAAAREAAELKKRSQVTAPTAQSSCCQLPCLQQVLLSNSLEDRDLTWR